MISISQAKILFGKTFVILLFMFALTGCANQNEVIPPVSLPAKSTQSMLINDSVILPSNLDNYLFINDVFYVDTRDPNQFLEEGHVAGFVNIPFYQLIANLNDKEATLFKMTKVTDTNGKVILQLGDVGSFEPVYEESISIVKSIFPTREKILIISTAGVESTYLANLLVQLGYEPENIYNVGNYSNSIGNKTSYRELDNAKHRVTGVNSYRVRIEYDFGDLHRIVK